MWSIFLCNSPDISCLNNTISYGNTSMGCATSHVIQHLPIQLLLVLWPVLLPTLLLLSPFLYLYFFLFHVLMLFILISMMCQPPSTFNAIILQTLGSINIELIIIMYILIRYVFDSPRKQRKNLGKSQCNKLTHIPCTIELCGFWLDHYTHCYQHFLSQISSQHIHSVGLPSPVQT